MGHALPKAEVEAQINRAMVQWMANLEYHGFDKDVAMNPLGRVRARLSSDFGPRGAPTAGASTDHTAYDLVPLEKTSGPVNVYASTSGTVLFDGWYTEKSGRVRIVGGDNGRMYVYGHLDESDRMRFNPGDRIERGQILGHMGQTGTVTAPCLHYVERHLGVVKGPDGRPAIEDVNGVARIKLNPIGEQWSNLRFHQKSGNDVLMFQVREIGRHLRWNDFTAVPPTIGKYDNAPLHEGSVVEPSNLDQLVYSRRFREEHGVVPRPERLANDAVAAQRSPAPEREWPSKRVAQEAKAVVPASGGWMETISSIGCAVGITSCPAQAAKSRTR